MSINNIGNYNLRNKSYEKYDYTLYARNNTNNSVLSSQNATDVFEYNNQEINSKKVTNTNALKQNLQETKSKQGFIGKLWDGFKNLSGIGASSNKAEKAIENYENGIISEEEMLQKINNYEEGQKMVVDVTADIASGILAVGAFALAVPTGGASLAVGLGLATTVGAGVKIGIKAGDALATGKKYSSKDLLYDTATGAINGFLAPVTNGIGNSVTKTIGTKLGLSIAKEGGEEIVEQGIKQGLKSAILNQTTDVAGGTITKRAVALGAGMAVDGALGGAGDNMIRAGLNGENILKAGVEGAVGGAIMAPIIGGGFRIASKTGQKISNNLFKHNINPNENIIAKNVISDDFTHKTIAKSPMQFANEVRNLDTNLAREYADAIEKAINEGKYEKLSPEKLEAAFKLLNPDSEASKELKNLSGDFYDFLKSNDYFYTKNAGYEIADVLGFEGDFKLIKGKEAFILENENGIISIRPKSKDSVFSKAKNKVLGLKTDIPKNLESLRPLIADAQGVRLVVNSADKLSPSTIKDIVNADIPESEFDDFIKYIENKYQPKDAQLDKFQSAEKKLFEKISNNRSDEFSKKLAQAIKEGKIKITELHNYSSQNGIPYLNKTQVDTIKEAYSSWYQKEYALAKAGKGGYAIKIDENGLEYLTDKSENHFYKNIVVESISDNHKKAIKNNGYTATQFNLVSKDGQLVEFQYRGANVDDMAESEHIIYDIRKNKDTILGEEYKEVREIIGKIKNNQEIINEYDRYYNDVFKTYRKQELGINAEMPDISDYPLLKKALSKEELEKIDAKGIIELHKNIKAKKAQK